MASTRFICWSKEDGQCMPQPFLTGLGIFCEKRIKPVDVSFELTVNKEMKQVGTRDLDRALKALCEFAVNMVRIELRDELRTVGHKYLLASIYLFYRAPTGQNGRERVRER